MGLSVLEAMALKWWRSEIDGVTSEAIPIHMRKLMFGRASTSRALGWGAGVGDEVWLRIGVATGLGERVGRKVAEGVGGCEWTAVEVADGLRVDGRVIRGLVPLAEMFGYATSLRSLTQGRATFVMEFIRYELVPPDISEKIIAGSVGGWF